MNLLAKDEVHLWTAALDQPGPAPAELSALLSDAERAHAARFHRPRDATRYSAGRGILRSILAAYVGGTASQLRFRTGTGGKPALIATADGRAVEFNLAHAEGLAVYAITGSQPVGVDVEHVRPMPDAAAIAASRFTPRERAAIDDTRPPDRDEAFLRCWTRKEAFVKALGVGLSYPLDQVEVSVGSGGPPRVLTVGGRPEPAAFWSLVDLTPEAGFVGALAIRTARVVLRPRRWPDDTGFGAP